MKVLITGTISKFGTLDAANSSVGASGVLGSAVFDEFIKDSAFEGECPVA